MSREKQPKQFIDMFGTGRTLLQATFDRMARLFPIENIIISTCADQQALVQEQLPEIPAANILAEPIRRGTLPAAFWANTVIRERDVDACVLCTPADQIVLREHDFEEDTMAALTFVQQKRCIVTLGITPTRPDTFYGYLQAGECDNCDSKMTRIKAFTEKPDAEFARMFVDSGEFYWNTGIHVWHALTMNQTLKGIDTDYAAKLLNEAAANDEPLSSTILRQFGALPNKSLDLTIQDKMNPVYMRICSFTWADMGNWHSMHDDLPSDHNGNVTLHSEALLYNCSGNVIKMPKGVAVVMHDIHDKVVVQHDGVLLIVPKDSYGEMRRIMTDAQIKLKDKE